MVPTLFDFLKAYLEKVLGIQVLSDTLTKEKEKEALACHKSLLKWDEETCSSEDGSQDYSQQELPTEASEGAAQECSLAEKELKVK